MSSRSFTDEQLREIIALFQVYGDIKAVNRYGKEVSCHEYWWEED